MSILEAIMTAEQNLKQDETSGFQLALDELRKNKLENYIANFKGEIDYVAMGDQICPYYIPNYKCKDDTYLGSIINQYITYGIDEWEILNGKKWWMDPLKTLSTSFFRSTQIDKSIHMNANLLSTSFLPSMNALNLFKAAEHIHFKYPKHALVVRGMRPSILMGGLKYQGFKRLTNRKVYEIDLKLGFPEKKRPLEQDQKRWNKQSEFSWRPIQYDNKFEMAQVMSMYQAVYRERHSHLNPDYSCEFIQLALKTGWLEGEVMVDTHDRPLGVQLYLEKEGHITTPFIGYDTSLPKKTRIYPFLNLRLMHRAHNKGLILNMSSGAGKFKKQRGGIGHIEYLMVYTEHLSFFRRLPWKILMFVSNKWVKPYLEENDV